MTLRMILIESAPAMMSIFLHSGEVHGVSEKVLHRLEQLDVDTGSKQFFGGLSQEEYTAKVNHQSKTFIVAKIIEIDDSL